MKYDKQVVLDWFRDNGIAAQAEFRFDSARLWRFDFAWVEHKVALEVQGGMFQGGRHVAAATVRSEMEKMNAAAVQGWRVLQCLPDDVCMSDTVDLIKAAMEVG